MGKKELKTEKEYRTALKRLEQLSDVEEKTKEGELLADLIEEYDKKHYPIPEPDPIEEKRYIAEQMKKQVVTPEEMAFYKKSKLLLKKLNDNFKQGLINETPALSNKDYTHFQNILGKITANQLIDELEKKELFGKKWPAIKTEQQYQKALSHFEKLYSIKSKDRDNEEVSFLKRLITDYEKKHSRFL